MKIFCDTNIITEFLEKRLLFDAVAKILTLASTSHTLFLSEGGFYTITFLVDKQLRRMSIYKRVCHKSVTHPFLFFAFSQIRNL